MKKRRSVNGVKKEPGARVHNDTEVQSSMDAFVSKIRPTGSWKKKSGKESDSAKDIKRFESLVDKITHDKLVIDNLRTENEVLREEIQRYQKQISSYPTMRRKYGQLSRTLSRIARSKMGDDDDSL
jgi:hypothetical protein